MKIEDMSIAFVTPWRDKGGISTYAEELVPRIASRCKDYIVLAETAPEVPEEDKVVRCWTRGEDLSKLGYMIQAFQPDAVYVEHQYGLFPNQWEWTTLCRTLAAYPHLVKMHSVFGPHLSLIGGMEKPDYLGKLGRIIVHTTQADDVLRTARQLANVSVISHGCSDALPPAKAERPTVFSFGFGLKYKGLETALSVVKELLPKYPDLLYLGVFSEEPRNSPAYNAYYEEMTKLIAQEGLQRNFLLFKGYKEETYLRNFARTCAVALFSYTDSGDRNVYGTSGAARLAMSWGLPVVTSSNPLFYDLEGVAARGSSEEEMVAKVELLLSNETARSEQLQKQKEFVEANSWSIVAEKHIQLLENRGGSSGGGASCGSSNGIEIGHSPPIP